MKKLFFVMMILFAANASIAQQIKKVKIAELVKMIDTSTTPLLVNFFATWCQPCVHEIPWFEKNVAEYKAKGVKLILVSIDFVEDYPKGIADFVKKNNYQSQVIWLNETNADLFCPKIDKSWSGAIPVSLMVNNKKHYRKFFGDQVPEPKLKLALKELVE